MGKKWAIWDRQSTMCPGRMTRGFMSGKATVTVSSYEHEWLWTQIHSFILVECVGFSMAWSMYLGYNLDILGGQAMSQKSDDSKITWAVLFSMFCLPQASKLLVFKNKQNVFKKKAMNKWISKGFWSFAFCQWRWAHLNSYRLARGWCTDLWSV